MHFAKAFMEFEGIWKQPGKEVGILHYMAFGDYKRYTKYSACKKGGEKIVVRVSQGIAEE